MTLLAAMQKGARDGSRGHVKSPRHFVNIGHKPNLTKQCRDKPPSQHGVDPVLGLRRWPNIKSALGLRTMFP